MSMSLASSPRHCRTNVRAKLFSAASNILWLDVPLVAHDRDLERVPGLRILTIHADWQVREEGLWTSQTAALWLGKERAAALLSTPQALGAMPLSREEHPA